MDTFGEKHGPLNKIAKYCGKFCVSQSYPNDIFKKCIILLFALIKVLVVLKLETKTWEVEVEWADYRTKRFGMTFKVRLKNLML